MTKLPKVLTLHLSSLLKSTFKKHGQRKVAKGSKHGMKLA